MLASKEAPAWVHCGGGDRNTVSFMIWFSRLGERTGSRPRRTHSRLGGAAVRCGGRNGPPAFDAGPPRSAAPRGHDRQAGRPGRPPSPPHPRTRSAAPRRTAARSSLSAAWPYGGRRLRRRQTLSRAWPSLTLPSGASDIRVAIRAPGEAIHPVSRHGRVCEPANALHPTAGHPPRHTELADLHSTHRDADTTTWRTESAGFGVVEGRTRVRR